MVKSSKIKQNRNVTINGSTVNPVINKQFNGEVNSFFFSFTKSLIEFAAWFTGLTFAGIQIANLILNSEFANALSDVKAKYLLDSSLAIYFICWVWGTKFDLKDEKYSFYTHKHVKSRFFIGIVFILVLWGAFMLICRSSNTQQIALFLLVFYFIDFVSWRYLLFYLRDIFAANDARKLHDHEYYMGKFIKEFLKGKGQNIRFGIGFFMLLLVNFLIYTKLSESLASLLNIPSHKFVEAFFITLFVIVNEILMWYRRLRRIMKFKVLSIIPETKITQVDLKEDGF
jgi:hypothetical protein